ncbi:hypothetical protein [Streptacidiphilus rugosus]|uniref:hypothetical protein n=1 Tax=Streptacidiphilus rugosus TaxID=405783 RepID=UPI00068C4BE7|nr:hypothetical protein [Streptacidiphilus rugosus]
MSGFVELVRGLRLESAPEPLPHAVAEDPGEEIAERFAGVAASAVHPLEVVAAIEAEGLTDRQIQQRYGRRDAFELGEELFHRAHTEPRPSRKRVPKRLRQHAASSAWGVPASRCALRGLLFALPGLGYVLGGPPHGSQWSVGAALLFSWSWSQGVAHLAYVRRGREDVTGAAAVLARGGVAGAVLATLLAALAPGSSALAVVFATGQALYFASATALLVLGRERALVAALAPMATGALWMLTARHVGAGGPPDWLGAVLLLLSVALAVRAGWRETGRPATARRGDWLPEWRDALQAGCFGLAVALLTLADIGPATLALTLSMGGAEWFLARCRGATELALGRAGATREFQRLVLAAVLRGLGGYLLVVAALTWAVGLLWPNAGGPGVGGLVALAAAIWTAQLLQSLGLLGRATAAVCAGAAALVAARAAGVPPGPAQTCVSAAAACVLLAVTALAVGDATRHR